MGVSWAEIVRLPHSFGLCGCWERPNIAIFRYISTPNHQKRLFFSRIGDLVVSSLKIQLVSGYRKLVQNFSGVAEHRDESRRGAGGGAQQLARESRGRHFQTRLVAVGRSVASFPEEMGVCKVRTPGQNSLASASAPHAIFKIDVLGDVASKCLQQSCNIGAESLASPT